MLAFFKKLWEIYKNKKLLKQRIKEIRKKDPFIYD